MCHPSTGCTNTPSALGTSCNDGIACTTNDVCDVDGHCAGTVTAACSATTCTTPTSLGATVDIPASALTATITLGGQPLPATNEYGQQVNLYLVSSDTGQWHDLASFFYETSSNPGPLSGPTVNPRVVAGVYDVYYCHNCEIPQTGVGFSQDTDATDAFPNGLRALATNVVVGEGSTHLSIDIPVASLSPTITLGGQPLPATNEYGQQVNLYLVSEDTGQWHDLASFFYATSANPGPLSAVTTNPRVVAGVYDVYYCHNCQIPQTGVGFSQDTDAPDAFPNGLRALQKGVTLKAGSNPLSVDIPVASLSPTITLGGSAVLPATNEYGQQVNLYLVSEDTGQWHDLASFFYATSANPGPLSAVTTNPRVVAGVYDVYYCHNCQIPQTGVGFSQDTDATDAFPNGLRALQKGVTLKAGSNPLSIDIPVASLSPTITLGGQPLPATNEYGQQVNLYLVSEDTGQWHDLASFFYATSANPGPLSAVTTNPRVVAGVYDVYYCHNCEIPQTGVGFSQDTDATDAFPNGLRALQKGVTLKAGSNALSIDIPVASLTAKITLGGQPLPATNEYGQQVNLYLVATDTGQWHDLASFFYATSANPGPLSAVTVNPRVVAGSYEIFYCHNCQIPQTGVGFSQDTDATDAFPNGLRALHVGLTIPSGPTALSIDIPSSALADSFTLSGQPLPSTNEYGQQVNLYLVSRDTAQWHDFASFFYATSANPGPLSAVTENPRVVSGAYDVYYCHNCEIPQTGVGFSQDTDATDAFPNGLRVLRSCVSVP